MVRALCSQVRSFLPPKQKKEHPKELRVKMPFPKRLFSERSKRSEKEHDERS